VASPAAFREIPLPQSWPVYVTHRQADAYVRWAGSRLPTEAEYHRGFRTPQGNGAPLPLGIRAAGAAAWELLIFNASIRSRSTRTPPAPAAGALADLIGNGWEWTSTAFCTRFPASSQWHRIRSTRSNFFRRQTLRDEGSQSGDGTRADSPVLAKLVLRRLSVRVRKFRCVSI